MTDSSPAIRARAEEVVRQMIQLALEVGADTVLVVPGLVTEEVSYEQAYERAQLACSRLADEVAGTGVAIAIENVWNRFLLSPLEMRQFIDEINHKEIQVYFDIGNVLPNGYPEQWIHILGNRIRRVHVKDFRNDIGNIRGFVSLFRGDVNWDVVLRALYDNGYNEYLTAEIPSGTIYASTTC